MTDRVHDYAARVIWEGNTGEGTTSYAGYGRGYRVQVAGKPDLLGTADPMFRGEADRHNPEDLLVAALSACHMLSYLALCARKGVRVLAYADDARGRLLLQPAGRGFESVTLHPVVTVDASSDAELALRLHEAAHEICFIAASCRMPVHIEARIEADSTGGRS